MRICKILHVKHNDSFRWKWCPVAEDGKVRESQDTYALFYECVVAAREHGYEPMIKLKCA